MASMKQFGKSAGTWAAGLGVMLLVFLIPVLWIYGIVWVSDKIYPWLLTISRYTFDICVLTLLLCIFRKTRPWAGLIYLYSSFVFGAVLFVFSCLYTVQEWGYLALVIGLIFAGVGVVPVDLLAALFHLDWGALGSLVLSLVLTFGLRYLGAYLATAKERAAERAANAAAAAEWLAEMERGE